MNSPIPWPGGKRLLLKRITALVPAHTIYIEPFCGGADLLYAKEPAKVEVINDVDGELINFWQIVRNRHDELIRGMRWLLHSRRWFRELLKSQPCQLDQVERAVRFYYLRKSSFGGKGMSFGRAKSSNVANYLYRAEEVLTRSHERLRRVTIEEQDFAEVFGFFDDSMSFAYLDPPYRNSSDGLYDKVLCDADYTRLQEMLARAKGKWLLSHADDPWIRDLFSNFKIYEVHTKYTLAGGKCPLAMHKNIPEIMIANY